MMSELIFLGGTEEIGANSLYLYFDGTGIIIDAGLHPKKRDCNAFPICEFIQNKPTDLLILTHAHTDHIGGIPYLLKFHPHLKIIATAPTCDLTKIMLKDTAKLLKSEVTETFPSEALSLYKPESLSQIWMLLEDRKYNEPFNFCGRVGRSNVKITLFPSGHIIGSASIAIECNGVSLLHTGDVQFRNQAIIPKAAIPRKHVDVLISECTNAGDDNLPDYDLEKKRLAVFINQIVEKNGSILIPSFALGKTQEILKIIDSLMKRGSIPTLPIYTAGLGRTINRIYDVYCYTVPMQKPGFEVSDIPQEIVRWSELNTGNYFKEPSIVILPSGMLNSGTFSFNLTKRWMKIKNFGIAFVGYQDVDSPGFELLNSEPDKEFIFAGKKNKRVCQVEKFRFTSHASKDALVDFISDIKPERLFIVHGDIEASDKLAENISDVLPQIKISIPKLGYEYKL